MIAKAAATSARAKNYKDFYLGTYLNDGRFSSGVPLTHELNTLNMEKLHVIPLYDEDTMEGDSLFTRADHSIWIRGFSVTGQIRLNGTSDMSDCVVQIVLFRQKRSALPTEAKVLSDLPTTILYNKMNGSLPAEDDIELASKVQILVVKTVSIKPIMKKATVASFRFSKFWKRPQQQNYAPGDLTGVNPFDWAYFLAARTNEDYSGSAMLPVIIATCRCKYFTE